MRVSRADPIDQIAELVRRYVGIRATSTSSDGRGRNRLNCRSGTDRSIPDAVECTLCWVWVSDNGMGQRWRPQTSGLGHRNRPSMHARSCLAAPSQRKRKRNGKTPGATDYKRRAQFKEKVRVITPIDGANGSGVRSVDEQVLREMFGRFNDRAAFFADPEGSWVDRPQYE